MNCPDCGMILKEKVNYRKGSCCYSAFATPSKRVIELCLCEQNHLILKPNQLYIFKTDEKCKSCVALEEEGRK